MFSKATVVLSQKYQLRLHFAHVNDHVTSGSNPKNQDLEPSRPQPPLRESSFPSNAIGCSVETGTVRRFGPSGLRALSGQQTPDHHRVR